MHRYLKIENKNEFQQSKLNILSKNPFRLEICSSSLISARFPQTTKFSLENLHFHHVITQEK